MLAVCGRFAAFFAALFELRLQLFCKVGSFSDPRQGPKKGLCLLVNSIPIGKEFAAQFGLQIWGPILRSKFGLKACSTLVVQ